MEDPLAKGVSNSESPRKPKKKNWFNLDVWSSP